VFHGSEPGYVIALVAENVENHTERRTIESRPRRQRSMRKIGAAIIDCGVAVGLAADEDWLNAHTESSEIGA
jgi:hypothetical protein